jgi:hypothetical protein
MYIAMGLTAFGLIVAIVMVSSLDLPFTCLI